MMIFTGFLLAQNWDWEMVEHAQDYKVEPATTVCKHWKRIGNCLYGDLCKFSHNEEYKGVGKKHSNSEKRRPNGRLYVRNESKATFFRHFLLDEFGRDLLRVGSGVLDVAGGRGDLAFQLVNLNDIKTTIIDPRPLSLTIHKLKLGYERGFYHRSPPLQDYNDVKNPAVRPAQTPSSIRLFFEPYLYSTFGEDSNEIEDIYYSSLVRAYNTQWTRKGLVHTPSSEFNEAMCLNKEASLTWESIQKLVYDSSCIVGLHPDQAAEYIIDCAMTLNKPFAIIPCCTYSKEFPGRKTKDGKQVKSYEQLIQYLRDKHPLIKSKTLPFEGKNIVLYADLRTL